jgi:hypothetical protein
MPKVRRAASNQGNRRPKGHVLLIQDNESGADSETDRVDGMRSDTIGTARVLLRRCRQQVPGLVLIGTVVIVSGDALAELLKTKSTRAPLLAACHFAEDSDAFLRVPIFDGIDPHQRQASAAKAPKEKAGADADADEEDEDEDEDDEDGEESEDSDPPVRNFIAIRAGPGLQRGPCYKISGSAAYSITLLDGASSINRTSDRLRKEARATLGLHMIEDLPIARFRAALELEWSSAAGTNSGSVSGAWMSLGPVTLGVKGSHFDFWAGDEFGFKATAPSVSTFLTSLALRTSEKSTLTLSAEDPITRRLVNGGYGGVVLPDSIARWQYESDSTTLHFGGALRQLRFQSPDRRTRYGYAVLFGVQQQVASIGTDDYLTAQAAYADTAPGYLGIAQPGGLLNFTLPRNAPVAVLETMRGWTAALAYSHGWSERWRSNAFATFLDLRVTEGIGNGKVQVGRAAVNVVWTPIKGLDLTWELGAGRVYRLDSFVGLATLPSRTSYSGQFSVSRNF